LENEISTKDNELRYLKEQTVPREDFLSLKNQLESEINTKNNQLKYLKESTVPHEDYLSLKNQLESEINTRDNELKYLKEQTISREEYLKLQGELNRKNDKIKRLEEINTFFNELQEEQEAFDTVEKTPPFRLEKKQKRR
jgi:hypothetical protein